MALRDPGGGLLLASPNNIVAVSPSAATSMNAVYHVYLHRGAGANAAEYRHVVLTITRATNDLGPPSISMRTSAGTLGSVALIGFGTETHAHGNYRATLRFTIPGTTAVLDVPIVVQNVAD